MKIAKKIMPFSNIPGACCLIPGTTSVVIAYPALIKVVDLITNEIQLEHEIVVKDSYIGFQLCQDLERGVVHCFGRGFSFFVLPGPVISSKSQLCIDITKENLSFGVHKKQCWPSCKARLDIKEIFPVWFSLAQYYSDSSIDLSNNSLGVFELLKKISDSIEQDKRETTKLFLELFLCGFSGIMVPRLFDLDYMGICNNKNVIEGHPLAILVKGAHLIKKLLFDYEDNNLFFLPKLLPELFAGRLLNLQCSHFGECDIEWSKKSIKKIFFRAKKDSKVIFNFKNISDYRIKGLNNAFLDKGVRLQNKQEVEIKSGQVYLLDCFKK